MVLFDSSHLVVGMDGDKETGQQLGVNKEITEEPALVYGGDGDHHLSQVICIAVGATEGPKHAAVIPGNRVIPLADKIFYNRKCSNKI